MAGWKSCSRERRMHRETQAAYASLVIQHRKTLAELERERERSSKAFFAATEPCPMCEEMERERNNAELEKDTALDDLRGSEAVRADLEQLLFGDARADGGS